MIKRKIGDILIEKGLVTDEQVGTALALQKTNKRKLGIIMVGLGYLTEEEIIQTLSEKFDYEVVDCGELTLTEQLMNLVPKKMAEKEVIIPVELEGKRLKIAVSDPLNLGAVDDLKFRTGLNIDIVLSTETSIMAAVERNYGKSEQIWSLIKEIPTHSEVEFLKEEEEKNHRYVEAEALIRLSATPPIIKLVSMIFVDAVKSRASDIHIEPGQNQVRVRYRIDGELVEAHKYPKEIMDSVVSRVKILSNLDITNRRTPQDGRASIRYKDSTVDLRVSTLPSIYGETIVIRILDKSMGLIKFHDVGMPDRIQRLYSEIIANPQGVIIITGPTGSGKTSTIYASLNQLVSEQKNIVSVEDPIEFNMPGITQTQVNEAVGLTFPVALRAFFRQDPDIMMVGEVRDLETAQIAVRAALTGHLVITTLHTNDAVSTLTRLIDIGVEKFLVASTVIGIMAQRLVRKICPRCRVEIDVPSIYKASHLPVISRCFRGAGCDHCRQTGYWGRIGVFELLPATPRIKSALSGDFSEEALWEAAKAEGFTTMFEDGIKKIEEGVTTIEEAFAKIPYVQR
ncbi:GspE/PulE family protein [Desulforegula conservatrix]|uniref:GspE/PulE family protein n=1 Tax=Desulforegula conservatrix TaxID=153026 RepID=UPI000404B6BA|nr:ATPase, T2SS/T4P/T4SS family [Desulforegula conservatrix]